MTTSDPAPGVVGGAVLNGGQSERMGRDKAAIEIDGLPMSHRVARALDSAGARPTIFVGGDQTLATPAWPVIEDRTPGQGPLGGVLTALDHLERHGSLHAVVLSCDLLRPDVETVRTMITTHLREGPDLTVVVSDGRVQWTHAVWSIRTRAILDDMFDAGERSIVGAASALRVVRIPVESPSITADADRPSDLPFPTERTSGEAAKD